MCDVEHFRTPLKEYCNRLLKKPKKKRGIIKPPSNAVATDLKLAYFLNVLHPEMSTKFSSRLKDAAVLVHASQLYFKGDRVLSEVFH